MSNYKAIIAKVDMVIEISGADRVQIGKVLGECVVISKNVSVGDLGVFFCAGTQLSEQYCHENNLFRDTSKNKDTTKAGFFENLRRVRAQPFLKVRSEAYFAGLDSLNYATDTSQLKVGDSFEDLGSVKICNKFVLKEGSKVSSNTQASKTKLTPFFKEHTETGQYKYNTHLIEKGDLISIQSKRHGTSGRYGYTKTLIQLPKWKQVVNNYFNIFPTETYKYVVGTRRVVLGFKKDKDGFHGSEAFRFKVLDQLKVHLTKGMQVYVEIVGYANDKPIMPNHSTKSLKDKSVGKKYGESIVYSYGNVQGGSSFHIYRITLATEDGTTIDFTQKQLVQWCKDRGLDPALDLVEPMVYDGDIEKLSALVDILTERPEHLTEDYHTPTQISEGVIIRVDRGTTTPLFLKSKSYFFKVMEGIASETQVDIEETS